MYKICSRKNYSFYWNDLHRAQKTAWIYGLYVICMSDIPKPAGLVCIYLQILYEQIFTYQLHISARHIRTRKHTDQGRYTDRRLSIRHDRSLQNRNNNKKVCKICVKLSYHVNTIKYIVLFIQISGWNLKVVQALVPIPVL